MSDATPSGEEIARPIILLIGGAVLFAFAIYAAVIIGMFAITILAGVIGLLCVKVKYPLLNPNGPIIVTAGYALAWSAGITLALFFGSILLNEVRSLPNPPSKFQTILSKDAPLFFVQAAWVLYAAARRYRSAGTVHSNTADPIFCGLAALSFSISADFLSTANVLSQLTMIGSDVMETILFPIQAPMQFLADPKELAVRLFGWGRTVDANLFRTSDFISKVLWILALFKFLKGIFFRGTPQKSDAPTSVDVMTTGESVRFAGTMFFFGLTTSLMYLSYLEDSGAARFQFWIANPIMTIFLSYIGLWTFLLYSRRRT